MGLLKNSLERTWRERKKIKKYFLKTSLVAIQGFFYALLGKESKMRGTKCKIIFNTKNGYCMTPIECKSISQAVNLAKETSMAFRIFVNGKGVVKRGWFV